MTFIAMLTYRIVMVLFHFAKCLIFRSNAPYGNHKI